MERRQHQTRSFSTAAEVLELRSLLSGLSVAGHAGAIAQHFHAAAVHQSAFAVADHDILSHLSKTPVSASTIPENGDVNPYGVAFVPAGFAKGGALKAGDVLVSNFNASSNLQGTGTTIVRVTPTGTTSTFFQGETGLGLTTALGVLKRGYVIVGNVPTTDGTSDTVQQGSLLILDKNGNLVTTLTDADLLNGPWDLTINDQGATAQVFVSNVLSGTVARIDLSVPKDGSAPTVLSKTQIASGYMHRADPAALELGPTGLVFDSLTGNLYVASTADNAVYVIPDALNRTTDAGTGSVVFNDSTHLHGPLGMVRGSNGDLIVSNGDAVNADAAHPSTLVEFTPQGQFVSQFQLDPAFGAAFGIAFEELHNGKVRFAAVDDSTNTVRIWTFKRPDPN
jgi:hypothetical protein